MRSCDVLIVGGGPAGSSCARRLSHSGLAVSIIDAKEFPRDKVCAGWVTPPVLDALDIDAGVYARDKVLQPFYGFRTGLLVGSSLSIQNEVETRYPEIASFGIRRIELDDYLLRRSSAELILGEPVRSIEQTSNGWLVNGDLKARMLVGAGGHFCPIARHFEVFDKSWPAVLAQEIEIQLDNGTQCGVDAEVPQLFFCDDLKGYGWAVRKGGFLNIGLGREQSGSITDSARLFCQQLIAKERIPPSVPQRLKGHAYRLYLRPRPTLSGEGWLLIGDAAGLAHPQSGEGIRPAIESGLLAAEVIASCSEDFSATHLSRYGQQLHSWLGTPSRRPGSFAASLRARAGRQLLGQRWFARHLLLDRWFLGKHRPVWSPTAIQSAP